MNVVLPTPFVETEESAKHGQIHTLTTGASWDALGNIPLAPLIVQDGKYCIKISRATLMSLFAMSNARPIFNYASASGYRSAYPSYAGQGASPGRLGNLVWFH
jgi:hypothetical protein